MKLGGEAFNNCTPRLMPNADKEAGYCVFRSSASLPCAMEVTAQTIINAIQNFNINMRRTKQPALPGHYDLVTQGNGWDCVPHISRPRELPIRNHRKSYCPGPQLLRFCLRRVSSYDLFEQGSQGSRAWARRARTCCFKSYLPRATHARVRKLTVRSLLSSTSAEAGLRCWLCVLCWSPLCSCVSVHAMPT